jgi:hypothetical protein
MLEHIDLADLATEKDQFRSLADFWETQLLDFQASQPGAGWVKWKKSASRSEVSRRTLMLLMLVCGGFRKWGIPKMIGL